MATTAIFVSVPVTSFRAPHAREYLQSLDVPPPATVYGMLLSLVGETDRRRHSGCQIALACLTEAARSTLLRTSWHVKDLKQPPGIGSNKRPDFQEVLTGLRIAVFIRKGATERAEPPLADRVEGALEAPGSVTRFGGLSLGESAHLVDDVRPLRDADLAPAKLLTEDPTGITSLPVWVDHVGSSGTRWGRFRLDPVQTVALGTLPESAWIEIAPS